MKESVRLEDVNVEIEYDDISGKVELRIEEDEITSILNVQVRQGEGNVRRMLEDMKD